jgi:hypothetical protein
MFDIGFCSLIIFSTIAIIVGVMDNSKVSKEIVYVTAGIGYGGLAVGFIIASLKWLFLSI